MAKVAAKRPEPRSVTARITEGRFTDWQATMRADFSVRLLLDIQSGDLERVYDALGKLIIDHNMPDENDEVATDLKDVSPQSGLNAIVEKLVQELALLPNA